MCAFVFILSNLSFILRSHLGVLYQFRGFARVSVNKDGALDYGAVNSGKGEFYQILQFVVVK